MNLRILSLILLSVMLSSTALTQKNLNTDGQSNEENKNEFYILTPPPPLTPRINGAKVFGVRPGNPFLFTIAATGERPVKFEAEGLPEGLKLDSGTGRITGKIEEPGTYHVMLRATNMHGSYERGFRIHVGSRLALTPPMGWNSYNVYGIDHINQERAEINAKAFVDAGLQNHGWTYFNLDGGWQGYERKGKYHAIIPDNERFPDFQGLIDYVHELGLKFGLYHQAYINSYDKRLGATSNYPDGRYVRSEELHPPLGKYKFHWNDAQQFAEWGVDYLKYDWWKRNLPHAIEMADALENLDRDIVYSVCNGAGFTNGYRLEYPEADEHARGLSYNSHLWRSGADTENSWESVIANGFTQGRWRNLVGPGHWNDADMMLLGWIGWGDEQHPTSLTADEQYSHMSLWCLLASPLLLGCDLTKLDEFTLNLLTNDEVIAVNQDPLGRMAKQHLLDIYQQAWVKEMEDGSVAIGLFNLNSVPETISISWKLADLSGKQKVRDLWRQKDLGEFIDGFETEVRPHGVIFIRVEPTE